MQNQIEYSAGYTPSLTDPENSFVFGKGWSYGMEWFINKTKGRLTGWIGYTLSWTWRQFPDLNNGQKFTAKYYRRNELSVVGIYVLDKQWKFQLYLFSLVETPLLSGKILFGGRNLTQDYSRINQYRLPPYNHLDLAAIMPTADHKNCTAAGYYFNVYSRLNPILNSLIYVNPSDGSIQIQAKKFPFSPFCPP
jgi:hypothetical protein